MERVKILSWDKVSLVVPEKEDVKLWYKWVNDIENQMYLWSMFWRIISEKSEEEFFENLNKTDDNITFSIYVEEINKSIWNIWLIKLDYKSSNAELWIAIFDKENQNKWYWTEAIKLIQKYVFEILWLNKFYLRYISFNTRAWKVYEKCWFKSVWIMKKHEYRMWSYHDIVIMEILKEEYLNQKNSSN